MKPRKICGWALLGLTLTALASCGGGEKSESTDSSTSESSIPSTTADEGMAFDLENYRIPQGTTFFDGCKPSVIYDEEEVGDYVHKTTYTIVGEDGKTYGAGDILPAGNYTVNVRFSSGGYHRASRTFVVESSTPVTASEGNGYKTYSLEDLALYNYKNFQSVETLGGGGMPSKGDVNILVIPVQFTNVTFDNPDTETDEGEFAREVINEAFFGDSDDTPWESLRSYYQKASNGLLNISGEVTSIYTYPASDADIPSTQSGLASTIAIDAVKWLKDQGEINPKDYDADKDGYIDGVEIIYTTTHGTPSSAGEGDTSNDLWWNYTTNAGGSKNVENPGPHRLFWSRWDMLTSSYLNPSDKGHSVGDNKVDAHTIIHETGHMMGAPDYYSYDHDEGPAGCVDMMDNNVGDHNAYTKMQYGWVAPKVVDGSANNFEITLHSYTDTREFLLVRDTVSDPWNETPWDEYLMLEYYTPTGLNEEDSDGYGEWQQASTTGGNAYGHGGTYEHPGLQVFHVDGRLAADMGDIVDGKERNKRPGYTDDPRPEYRISDDGTRFEGPAKMIHSNSGSSHGPSNDIVDGKYVTPTKVRELQAIFPSGVNSMASSSYASSFGVMANLFGIDSYWGNSEATGSNDKYGGSVYSNFRMRNFYMNDLRFNDGSVNNWTFSIVDQTDDTVTLHFVNNAAI